MSRILLTGSAGFIGYHLFQRLRSEGHQVLGVDNLNAYYDVNLKLARLSECGFASKDIAVGKLLSAEGGGQFMQLDLSNRGESQRLFDNHEFDLVCHLAAQAGVRYSIDNPHVYIDSNVAGFLHVLEGCRQQKVKRLVYASSSSVYGLNCSVPFRVEDFVDQPISLYAATKKSNELMAHCYSHLYGFPAIGLRFFTVYGPWGRPDMALFRFTRSILASENMPVYNHGDMQRDFTYIDDIVEGVWRVLTKEPQSGGGQEGVGGASVSPRRIIYNIGNGKPVKLLDFIEAIEEATGKKAKMESLPMQPGDVYQTWADTSALEEDYGFKPKIAVPEGVKNFVEWYKKYHGVDDGKF